MSQQNIPLSLISGFRRDVDEICGLLGYYAASCGNCLPTFRDNVSVPSSRVTTRRNNPGDRRLCPFMVRKLKFSNPFCKQVPKQDLTQLE
jgi:hypothetical protein